jgi:hypothetical protein
MKLQVCKRYLGPEEGNDFRDTLNSLMQFLLHASNSLADTVQTNFEKKRRNDITSGSLPLQTLKVNATSLPGSSVVVILIFLFLKAPFCNISLTGVPCSLENVSAWRASSTFKLPA